MESYYHLLSDVCGSFRCADSIISTTTLTSVAMLLAIGFPEWREIINDSLLLFLSFLVVMAPIFFYEKHDQDVKDVLSEISWIPQNLTSYPLDIGDYPLSYTHNYNYTH